MGVHDIRAIALEQPASYAERTMRSLVPTLIVFAAGCSAPVVDAPVEDDARTSQAIHGAVGVERVFSLTAGQVSLRTRVSARFLRARGGIDLSTAEELVSSPTRLADASPRALQPSRGCSWIDGNHGFAPARAKDRKGTVELVDVGEVTLRTGAASVALAQRAFPDVGDVVSGVVYTSRDDKSDLPVGTGYSVETTGSARVPGLRAQLDAPVAPAPVAIGGVELSGPAGRLELSSSEPLALTWEAGASASRDRIVVDIATDAGKRLRCAFDDRGGATIAANYLSPFEGSEVEISVHRHRHERVTANGIDGAVIDFDFAVATRATVTRD
jgi:hypothetical protein